MRRWLQRALVALLTAAAVGGGAHARELTRVYKAQHRSAQDLLPLADAALAGEGRAVIDPSTNSLVLTGSSRAIADALVLLAQQDRRLRSIVLRYEAKGVRELEAAGIAVDWSLGRGAVRVGNVIPRAGESGVALSPEGRSVRRESGFAGSMRVTEGESGRLLTGASAPVTTRTVRPRPGGAGGVVVSESTQRIDADTGFDARARILGDGRVEVELRPYEASLSRSGRVRRSEAATTLVLEPGQTVVVGSLDESRQERVIDLPGGALDERTRDERVLLLTAEVE